MILQYQKTKKFFLLLFTHSNDKQIFDLNLMEFMENFVFLF